MGQRCKKYQLNNLVKTGQYPDDLYDVDALQNQVLEADLEHPNHLHDLHCDLPFCPDHKIVGFNLKNGSTFEWNAYSLPSIYDKRNIYILRSIPN